MRERGMQAESIACAYLESCGYKVLLRNFHARYGEIDIIARHEEYLVFIEVKQRTTNRFASGREAVTAKKQQALRMAAQLYLAENNINDSPVRFDVVEITGPIANPAIEIIKNAF